MSASHARLLLVAALGLIVLAVNTLVTPSVGGAEQPAAVAQRVAGTGVGPTNTSTPTPSATATNTPTSTATLTPTATSTPTRTPTASATATATPQLPDLTIVKGASTANPVVGGVFTYTIVVTNGGSISSAGTSLVDPVPDGTTFVSASGGCFLLSGIVRCPVPALTPSQSQTYTLSVRVLAEGTISNTAIVDPDFQVNESDEFNNVASVSVVAVQPSPTSTPSNTPSPTSTATATSTPTHTATATSTPTLTPTATTTASPTTTASITPTPTNTATPTSTSTRTPTNTPLLPDLVVAKSASSGVAVAGSVLTYTLTVTNQGPGASAATTVQDLIPNGTVFSAVGPSCNLVSGKIVCDVSGLAAGASQTFTFAVTVAVTSGAIVNVAIVDPDALVAETDETNNFFILTIAVATPTPTSTRTLTPSPTLTPTITPIPVLGGRSFTLYTTRQMAWIDGNAEAAYFVVRWGPHTGNTFLPPEGPLPGNAIAYTDTTPILDQAYCYILALFNALPADGNSFLGLSDLLCVYPNSGAGPQRPALFSAHLNEGDRAFLSWVEPPGVTEYVLAAMPVDGSAPRTINLPAGTTAVVDPTLGVPTCYVLQARSFFIILGQTDILCVVPHIATVGAAAGAAPQGTVSGSILSGMQRLNSTGVHDLRPAPSAVRPTPSNSHN